MRRGIYGGNVWNVFGNMVRWIMTVFLILLPGTPAQAEITCLVDATVPGTYMCSGTGEDGLDVANDLPEDTQVLILTGQTSITNLTENAWDAVFNIDSQTVVLGQDVVVFQDVEGWEVSGVATIGEGRGQIINHGTISASGLGAYSSGIRLGGVWGSVSSNKTVQNYGTINVHGQPYGDGITVFGGGHSIVNDGQMIVKGDTATGVFAQAGWPADGQTLEVVNTGTMDVEGAGIAYGIQTFDYDDASITNAGLITVSASAALGMETSRAATIDNSGDLRVAGSLQAVGIGSTGPGAHIRSSGTIRVDLEANSSFARPATGIGVLREGNTVTNTGDVVVFADGTKSGSAVEAEGMRAEGNENALQSRDGTISVTAIGRSAYATGIWAEGRDNSIDAGVSISVLAESVGEDQEVADAAGVMLWGTGTLSVGASTVATTNGHDPTEIRVEARGQNGSALGIISVADGGYVEVTNRGLVDARASGQAAGALLGDFTDVNDDQPVVVFHNEQSGVIQAWALSEFGQASGVALYSSGDGSRRAVVEIHNQGIIGGYSSDGTATLAIVIGDSPNADFERIQVVNEGTLEGDVDLSTADGKVEVHLLDGSMTLGDVRFGVGENEAWVSTGGAAGLQGRLIGGGGEETKNTLYLFQQTNGPDEGDIAAKLTRFETIEILSGRWSLDQEGMGDRTTIVEADGVLRLSDTLRLGVSGRLGGNGTVEGDVINEVGTVAAGMSIGEITIIGNYVHGPNAVLEVETRAEHGTADKVVVTGTATLQGGTVNVLPEDDISLYRGKTFQYTVLEAEGGITGEFGESVSPAPIFPLFLRTHLSYGDGVDGGLDPAASGPPSAPNTVVLELTGLTFADLASTPNETSIASTLDDLYDHDPNAPLVKALYSYVASSESEFRSGLNSMSGEVYTAFPVVSVVAIDRFAGAIVRGMDEHGEIDAEPAYRGSLAARIRTTGRMTGWATAYGTKGTLKGDDQHAGADLKVTGAAAGMHLLSGATGRAGITAGFARSQVEMAERGSTLNGEGYQFGVYGQYDWGLNAQSALRLTGLVVHGRARYDAERHIAVGVGADSFSRIAESHFGGSLMLVSVRGDVLDLVGRHRDDGDGYQPRIQPEFGVSWQRTSRDAFEENGADDANLRVDDYTASLLRGDIGLQFTMRPIHTGEGWTINSSLRVAYVHDFVTPGRDVTVRMAANSGERHTIRGAQQAKGGFQVGYDVIGYRKSDDRLGWNLRYDGEIRPNGQTHAVVGGVTVRF